jgi:acetylornithine aminotransferase
MGAMLAREPVAAAFGPGSHASTFGGTPIVSAAALEVCRTLERDGVLDHARRVSDHFRERLEWLKGRHALVEEVRGRGLLLGIRLAVEGEPFVHACMARGFLINCVQGNVLRFVPPLVIGVEQIDALVACLDEIFGAARQGRVGNHGG